MKFLNFSNKTVVVSRMTAVSGNVKVLSTVTSTSGHIQPLDAERIRLIDGVYGKSFRIWVDSGVDIQEGDLLRDEDSNEYKVSKGGVTPRAEGSIDYQEILIEKTT